MSVALLTALGLGAPGLGLLVARRLAAEDASSMRRHRQALSVLAELTDGPAAGAGR